MLPFSPLSPVSGWISRWKIINKKPLNCVGGSDGASALHVASMNGHVDAVRALLRLGAAPEVNRARGGV